MGQMVLPICEIRFPGPCDKGERAILTLRRVTHGGSMQMVEILHDQTSYLLTKRCLKGLGQVICFRAANLQLLGHTISHRTFILKTNSYISHRNKQNISILQDSRDISRFQAVTFKCIHLIHQNKYGKL